MHDHANDNHHDDHHQDDHHRHHHHQHCHCHHSHTDPGAHHDLDRVHAHDHTRHHAADDHHDDGHLPVALPPLCLPLSASVPLSASRLLTYCL